MSTEEVFDRLAELIVNGDELSAEEAAKEAIAAGVDPLEAIHRGVAEGMRVIGEKFENFEIFLPQLMLAASAAKNCMRVLVPKISEDRKNESRLGKVVIGTVLGDIHDIGKNLVTMMMQGAGLEVIDLGIDVPPARFEAAIAEHRPQLLGLSALLTTTVDSMATTIKALEKAGLRDGLRIMVGGAPVTPEFANSIGADGYAADALSAVELATGWLQS